MRINNEWNDLKLHLFCHCIVFATEILIIFSNFWNSTFIIKTVYLHI